MKNLIIDFDSTFISVEGLEELAVLSLEGKEGKEEVLEEIKKITDLGMAGKISFTESLEKRLALLRVDKSLVLKLGDVLKSKITPSFAENIDFFKENNDNIYIISGGFRDFMEPVLLEFGIKKENIFANDFIYDENGFIIGFDGNNLLSVAGGKAKKIKELGIKNTVVLGDGYTDYEIKKAGLADKFYAFTGNVRREEVVGLADGVFVDFGEFLAEVKL
jgi:D-3-phosphoglycerate dehydrogenase / 2-oxoglutarate reductase